MARRAPARASTRPTRIRRIRVAGVLIVIAAVAAALGHGLAASSSPTAEAPPSATAAAPVDVQPGERRPRSSLDDGTPGVANLDPALLDALSRAAADAAADGILLRVESGWRSPEHQRRLLAEAILEYGSQEEAARWVATPERSLHVSGDAVDVAPAAAAAWLSERGAAYGLCRTYGNEPWHYELRPGAREGGCPPPYADPTHDPRMLG
jgi:LAS superfamily LD-carboxypeptidase LdcB